MELFDLHIYTLVYNVVACRCVFVQLIQHMQLVLVICRFTVMFAWIAPCMSELSVLICFCACANLKTKTNEMRTTTLW